MKAIIKKIYIGLSVFLGTFFTLAQAVPPPPPQVEASPGPGAPATPIDMYNYVLVIMVPVIIYYFKKKSLGTAKIIN